MRNLGTKCFGIKAPMIKEGDDIVEIVVNSILDATEKEFPKGTPRYSDKKFYDLNDNDIIGITESVVARSQGNYVTLDEIAEEIKLKFGENETIDIINPIYSRNRFAMILRGIARGCKKVRIFMPSVDEVGNVIREHPFTGLNYDEYYSEICKKEGCEVEIQRTAGFLNGITTYPPRKSNMLICTLHKSIEDVLFEIGYIKSKDDKILSLKDICNDKCEYGLLGSNKATEEKLKLFPRKSDKIIDGILIKGSDRIVNEIKEKIREEIGCDIIVTVYADGCFHDPVGGIWEFADPVSMVSYTDEDLIMSTPNEIKVKYFIDNKYGNLNGNELDDAIKNEIENHKGENLVGNMTSEGTTPRKYRDLIASLFDLTTGSGSKCTPFVLCQNYFQL